MFGIAGDLVLAAVSVVHLDDQHVNSKQVTDSENANAKQQKLEAGERIEYEEPFHITARSSILGKIISLLARDFVKSIAKPDANWFCLITRAAGEHH